MGVREGAPKLPRSMEQTAFSVSVAEDGSAWAVNAEGSIIHASEMMQPWLRVTKAGAIAASGVANLLFVTTDDKVEYRPADGSGGGGDLPAPPSPPTALTVLLTASNKVLLYALDAKRELWSCDIESPAQTWASCGTPADVVAGTSDGALYRLDNGRLYRAASELAWTQMSTPTPFADIAAAGSGWLWGVDGSGAVYQYDGSGGWESVAAPVPGPGASIAVGDDTTVWLLAGGGIWQYAAASSGWTKIGWEGEAPPAHLAVGDLEAAWAVDAQGDLWQYTEHVAYWEPLPVTERSFSCVSAVEARKVWAITGDGTIVRLSATATGWEATELPGIWTDVSASRETVWGVAVSTEDTCEWSGQQWTSHPMPPDCSAISVAGGSVAGLAGKTPYMWEGSTSTWVAVTPAAPEALIDLSVQPGGAIWAVTAKNELLLFLDTWIPVGSGLTKVSAGGNGTVWGITTSGTLLDLTGAGPLPGATAAAPHGSVKWDTESVYDEAQSTHLWLVNRAAELAQGQGSTGQAIYALVKPGVGRIGGTFHDGLCQGLYDADFKPEYNNPKLGQPTWASHFYDPDTHVNWLRQSEPTALTQGCAFFEQARDQYHEGHVAEAGYSLGLSLHYLTDLTQPMHAANFTYLSSHPRFGYHTDFEGHVMEIQSTVTPPGSYVPSTLTQPDEFLIEAAETAKSKYYDKVCPYGCFFFYGGFTALYKKIADENAPPILYDAVQIASQYLVAWMAAVSGPQ
jgi:hypothetical protein